MQGNKRRIRTRADGQCSSPLMARTKLFAWKRKWHPPPYAPHEVKPFQRPFYGGMTTAKQGGSSHTTIGWLLTGIGTTALILGIIAVIVVVVLITQPTPLSTSTSFEEANETLETNATTTTPTYDGLVNETATDEIMCTCNQTDSCTSATITSMTYGTFDADYTIATLPNEFLSMFMMSGPQNVTNSSVASQSWGTNVTFDSVAIQPMLGAIHSGPVHGFGCESEPEACSLYNMRQGGSCSMPVPAADSWWFVYYDMVNTEVQWGRSLVRTQAIDNSEWALLCYGNGVPSIILAHTDGQYSCPDPPIPLMCNCFQPQENCGPITPTASMNSGILYEYTNGSRCYTFESIYAEQSSLQMHSDRTINCRYGTWSHTSVDIEGYLDSEEPLYIVVVECEQGTTTNRWFHSDGIPSYLYDR